MLSLEERKAHILKSASELLEKKGLHDITIDEVAKQACFSKGGITHYYKNKDLLLAELANMLDADYMSKINEEASQADEACGAWTRALIKVSDADLHEEKGLNNALVAGAMASQKNGHETKSFNVIQEHVTTDGFDPVIGTIIRLAIDGLYYAELFKAPQLEPTLRQEVLTQLEEWTRIETTK